MDYEKLTIKEFDKLLEDFKIAKKYITDLRRAKMNRIAKRLGGVRIKN